MSRTEQAVKVKDGKPVTIEYRIADSRKLRRQALKNAQGNNRIATAWHKQASPRRYA